MTVAAAKVSGRLRRIARALDRAIEHEVGEKCGFMLLVWSGEEVSYVSGEKNREQAAAAMKELIAKWEAGSPSTPAHLRH